MRRLLAAAVAVLVAHAHPAGADDGFGKDPSPFFRSDNYFTETHYDVGMQSISGLAFDGGTASGTGLHLTEHNGILSRVPYLTIFFLAVIQAGGDTRLVGGVSTTTKESYYETKDPQGHVVDRTKIVSNSTTISATVVPLTEEEKRLSNEHLARFGKTMATFAMLPSHFELMYLPQRDNGRLRGIRGALYPLGIPISKYVEVAVGYAGAHLKADYMDPTTGTTRTLKHRSRAIALRLGIAPARFFVLTAEIHPNLLDLDDADGRYGTTVRATAAVSIPKLDRLYAKVGTERIGLGASGRWSSFFEGGVRF